MLTAFIPYFAVYIAYILLLLVTGYVVKRFVFAGPQPEGPFYATFLYLLIGMATLVTGFSLVVSGFKTINIGFVLLLLFFLYEKRKKGIQLAPATVAYSYNAGAIIAAVLFTMGFFFISFLKIYKGGEFPWIVYSGNDYSYNSMISRSLLITGIENKFIPEQIMSSTFPGINLYHFFDLWQTAGLSAISGLNNYLCYVLISDSIFMLLIYLGVLAILEIYFKVNILTLVIAFVLVFWGHLHLPVYNQIFYLSKENYRIHHFGITTMDLPKLLQIVPPALAACYQFLKCRYQTGLLVLLAIPIIYMSAIPVLSAVIIVMLALNFYFKWMPLAEVKRTAIYLVMLVVFIGVFFKLAGSGISEGKDKLTLDLFDMQALKTRINISALTTLQVTALYLPHLLIIALLGWFTLRSKELRNQAGFFLLFIGAIYFIGLGFWVLTFKNQDGMQLLGNNFPVINVLLLSLSLLLWVQLRNSGQHKPVLIAAAAIALLMTGYQSSVFLVNLKSTDTAIREQYADQYLAQIAKTNTGEKDLIGVFLKGEKEYAGNANAFAHRTSQTYKLSWYLALMPQYLTTTSLSIFDFPLAEDPLDRQREINAISGMQFAKFIEEQKSKESYVSTEQSQLDFISHYHIRYMVASSSAKLSPQLEALVTQTITDPVSGERFMLLK